MVDIVGVVEEQVRWWKKEMFCIENGVGVG